VFLPGMRSVDGALRHDESTAPAAAAAP